MRKILTVFIWIFRYGRRSNWFKIHCLLQEQQQQQQQQHQNQSQPQKAPHDQMILGLMDEYRNKRSSLSSSSPSVSSPDSHNSDSSVEQGDKKRIIANEPLKLSTKLQNPKPPNFNGLPLSTHLASIFQLMPSALGPLPLHLVPPPPLTSSLYRPFDYHHLYAHQNLLPNANLSPLANLPNNNLPDIVNNNLLNKSKTNDFYKKYYFNKIKHLSDDEDENANENGRTSKSPTAAKVIHSPSPMRSTPPHSPIHPIDLSMKSEDLMEKNANWMWRFVNHSVQLIALIVISKSNAVHYTNNIFILKNGTDVTI